MIVVAVSLTTIEDLRKMILWLKIYNLVVVEEEEKEIVFQGVKLLIKACILVITMAL